MANSDIKFINKISFSDKIKEYKRKPLSFLLLLVVVLAATVSVGALLFLVGYILYKGVPHLSPELFSWEYNSTNVSCLPAIFNTLIMTVLALLIAMPLGIGAAIYLAEYAKRESKLVKIIRTMAETLQGIPSIVYGLFGMIFFVTYLHWGYSLLAGSFTVAIMILPLIMRTTEEALLTVPDSYREGSFGLGAGKLRTILKIVLPSSIPGILAGVILAIGRIVGETAALIYTAGTVPSATGNIMDSGRTLAIHMYVLTNEGFYTDQAYATAVVLIVFVFIINTLSSIVAKKIGQKGGK